jgi:hypothetical protein
MLVALRSLTTMHPLEDIGVFNSRTLKDFQRSWPVAIIRLWLKFGQIFGHPCADPPRKRFWNRYSGLVEYCFVMNNEATTLNQYSITTFAFFAVVRLPL